MKRILYAVIVLMLLCAVGSAFGQKVSDEARRYFDRGMAAVEMAKTPADYEKAVAEFEKAKALAPDWPDVYYNLGLIQDKAGMYSEAMANLKRYLLLAPDAKDAEAVRTLINKLDYKKEQIGDRYGKFTDPRDDKIYKTVKIGNQVWLAENLAYKTQKGSWAYNNDENNVKTYGYLYDWEAAHNVCPPGWHLPSDQEWQEMEMNLGMSESEVGAMHNFHTRGLPVGEKMKSTGGWPDSGNETNEGGFAALPGGGSYEKGSKFYGIGSLGNWWSSTSTGRKDAWARHIGSDASGVARTHALNKQCEFSIRCIKD